MPEFMEQSNRFLVLLALIFVAVLMLIEGLWLLWRGHHGSEARRRRRRLDLAAGKPAESRGNLHKQRVNDELPLLQRRLRGSAVFRYLERLLLQSGLEWTVSRLVVFCFVFGLITWLALQLVPVPLGVAAPMLVLAAFAMPVAFAHRRRAQRLSRIEAQMPDALDLICRALRAGHAFGASLKMAGEEMPEPIAGEFRAVNDEINFGVSMQLALTHLSERVTSTDVRYFVVAVLIQRESGGNLTEILSNLSHLIRERSKLMGRIRVLTTEGRMSAWILLLLPFFLGGALYLLNPAFMKPMATDPIGISMLKIMLGLMALGAIVLRKLIRIRV